MRATVIKYVARNVVLISYELISTTDKSETHQTHAMLSEAVVRLFNESQLKGLLQPGRVVYVHRCDPIIVNPPVNETEPIICHTCHYLVTHISEYDIDSPDQ